MPRALTDEEITVFAEALRDILERDFASCQLEPGKKRTVNRVHYRKIVGLNGWDKYPLTERVFDRFDERISLAIRRTPDELFAMETWLRERHAEQSLHFQSDRVSRRQFGDAFGLDIRKVDREEPEISQLLSRWDTELGVSEYKPDKEAVRCLKVDMSKSPPVAIGSLFRVRQESTTSRRTGEILEELLEEDFQNDKLVVLQSGLISRQYYAAKLGMEKSAMTHYRPLFCRYEHLLGGLNEKYEAEIFKMKAWLEEQIDAGTLEFRGGKFDRSKFCEAFSIKFQGRLTGNAHLRKLVLETDQRLRESGYRSGTSRSEIESIRQLLVDPITNSDKLHVNQAHLSKMTGIARSRLYHAPFRPMIVEAENKIIEHIKQDGTKIFKHGKVFDFSPLMEAGWSLEFTGRIKTIFEERLGHRAADYLKASERVVISFFSFLGTSTQPAIIQAANAIREQKDVPHAIWTQTILAYGRGMLADKSARNGHSAANGINTILAEFGAAGIIPDAEVTVPLPPRETTPRKTLAEIFTPQNTKGTDGVSRKPRTQKLIAFAKWVLMQSSVPREDQTSFENQGFLVALEAELDKSNSLPDDPVEAIIDIMAKRLSLISEAAQKHVAYWYQHYEYGQKLLSRGINPRRYERFLPTSANDYSENIPRLREYFHSPENGNQGLCNLLRLIAKRRNRIFPALSPTSEDELYRSRVIREAIQAHGGIERLQAYLLPHRFAVASTIVLYLVESGANVAVARTLTIRAIEVGDGPEFAKITGKKSKAKGKPIILNLLEDSDCIKAMRWIIAAFKAMRRQLSPSLSTVIFLRRVGSSLRDCDEAWFGTWFKEAFGGFEGLAGVAPSMIRPSVMLKHSLENDGDLRTGLAYGQHSEEVGGVYQNRLITQFLRENLWNKFAHLMESIIIHNKVSLQKFLGVSADDNATRVAEVKRTGLGGFCTTGGCEKLNCWDKCPNHAVIADTQLMADLQIWNCSLKEVEGDWIRDHIERWEQEWFPWLWYTEVISQKMRQGSVGLRRIWNEATKLKDAMIAQPGFIMPRPF